MQGHPHPAPRPGHARTHPAPRRLLIPIDATESWHRGVDYAIDLTVKAEAVEVCLLYAVAPARDWEVLRFRTEEELRRHFQTRAEIFLDEAAAPLKAAGIPCRTYFREQEPALGIRDLAEQLECTEIVLPRPDWFDLPARSIVRRLKQAAGAIPVILIDAEGSVEP